IRSTPPRRPSQPRSDTRTSYQVGRPWMFDGKMLRGLTGTPMRRIDLAKRVFAEAEPEPLTLANLRTKSFTDSIRDMTIILLRRREPRRLEFLRDRPESGLAQVPGLHPRGRDRVRPHRRGGQAE